MKSFLNGMLIGLLFHKQISLLFPSSKNQLDLWACLALCMSYLLFIFTFIRWAYFHLYFASKVPKESCSTQCSGTSSEVGGFLSLQSILVLALKERLRKQLLGSSMGGKHRTWDPPPFSC